jgi:hypothetical protein
MPKLFTTNIKLPSIQDLEHDNVIMENKVGDGSGRHLMLDIWDSTNDLIEDQKYLAVFVTIIMEYFKTALKTVKIANYRLEHRVYIMDEESFIGKIHDDSCEYSVILYYLIDDEIVGGELNFYDDDATMILDCYQPKVGDMVILSGVHAVGKLYATKKYAKRCILILQINSEP